MEEHRLREAPLSMDADEFKAIGHRLIDQVAELLAGIPSRPVTPPNLSAAAIRGVFDLDAPLPEHGTEANALLTQTARQLFDCSLFNGHPRFFGYITAPPAPIGVLGDFLAAALNANVGMWTLAPAATEIEAQTVRWIGEFVGFPAGDGLLVSGGSAANINCFIAARAAAATWDVRREGVGGENARPIVAYASKEAHTWIQKAADICGLGTGAVRWIDTDANLQMDTAALRRAIDDDLAAGRLPFLVAGTAGSVSTGAVDRLDEIAALCREKSIWFHVDAAYGGFAAALPDAAPALRALREADSIAIDPHKWLYAPLEAGCALVRDADALTRAFAYHPPYYHMDQRVVNFVDHGSQNSRGFRALKVWLSLKQVGAAGFRQMIGDDMRLARALADFVDEHPELELLTQALSITTFRYVPPDLSGTQGDDAVDRYLNELNQRLLDDLQRGGEIFVSNAVIGGRYALRACIVNFNTTAADVEAVPDVVARQGRMLDARLRPTELRNDA
jgi:glutamate/tyrosine decarboxylase-like PLP-dependent enzyme